MHEIRRHPEPTMPGHSALFPVWGGTATVTVTEPARLTAARRAVEEVIADVDAACGFRRRDSELARVQAADGAPVQVGATFHAVLWTALHAAEIAHGTADLEQWRWIRIDEPPGTVALPRDLSLDLAGVGRAFAADRAAERAVAAAGCGVLVTIGRDVAVAGAVPADGWPVRLGHDHDLCLHDHSGVATTSVAAPPRTWRTVSVLAGNCVDAMIAGRAALARGHGAGPWLVAHGLAARLVHTEGWSTTVGTWPETIDWDETAVAQSAVDSMA